jgi:hypothetical protein
MVSKLSSRLKNMGPERNDPQGHFRRNALLARMARFEETDRVLLSQLWQTDSAANHEAGSYR